MRTTAIIAVTAIATLLSLVSPDYSCASEIVLRREHQCQETVVTLGEIAKVVGADRRANEQLASVELFPAPVVGRQRFVRVREIQDILVRRGVNLAKHRFSGASQIAISRGGRVERVAYEKPIRDSARRSANHRVHDAVLDYLRSNASATKSWNVELTLSSKHIRLLQGSVRKLAVSGGMSPWTGTQQFLVTVVHNDQQPVQLRVEAQVSLPPSVVVVNRAIHRDAIISAADLVLCSEVPRDDRIETYSSIEDVVGRQAVRTIAAGAIVERQWIRRPLLVRRSEIVTVTARAAGICVSTNARARADGSLGDLIPVESLQDRKTYYARVCGSREAEVFSPTVRARTVSRTASRPAGSSRPGVFGQRTTASDEPRQIQLNQPRSAQHNKLQRLGKRSWK